MTMLLLTTSERLTILLVDLFVVGLVAVRED